MISSSLLEPTALGCRGFRILRVSRGAGRTPDNREGISNVVDKLRRSLAEGSEPFLLREFLEEPIIQLLDFARSALAGAMEPGPLDVPADHFAHLARIKRLADYRWRRGEALPWRSRARRIPSA